MNTFNDVDYNDVLRNISEQTIEHFKNTNPEIVKKIHDDLIKESGLSSIQNNEEDEYVDEEYYNDENYIVNEEEEEGIEEDEEEEEDDISTQQPSQTGGTSLDNILKKYKQYLQNYSFFENY